MKKMLKFTVVGACAFFLTSGIGAQDDPLAAARLHFKQVAQNQVAATEGTTTFLESKLEDLEMKLEYHSNDGVLTPSEIASIQDEIDEIRNILENQ
ncbi:MAG: hypothetical protein R2798_01020 [Chitinophagales bacterium]